jgi:hypothetical protein
VTIPIQRLTKSCTASSWDSETIDIYLLPHRLDTVISVSAFPFYRSQVERRTGTSLLSASCDSLLLALPTYGSEFWLRVTGFQRAPVSQLSPRGPVLATRSHPDGKQGEIEPQGATLTYDQERHFFSGNVVG